MWCLHPKWGCNSSDPRVVQSGAWGRYLPGRGAVKKCNTRKYTETPECYLHHVKRSRIRMRNIQHKLQASWATMSTSCLWAQNLGNFCRCPACLCCWRLSAGFPTGWGLLLDMIRLSRSDSHEPRWVSGRCCRHFHSLDFFFASGEWFWAIQLVKKWVERFTRQKEELFWPS